MSVGSFGVLDKIEIVESALLNVKDEIGDLDLSAVAHQVATNKANIEILDISVNDLEIRVSALDVSVSIIETIDNSINLLDGRVSANETNISSLNTIITTKQDTITDLVSDNFITAGNNITFSTIGTNTTINGGGSTPVYFQCALNGNFVNFSSGNYLFCNQIVFQQPSTGTLVSLNNGFGYTIQESGVYDLGFKFNTNSTSAGTIEVGFVYQRGGVEASLSQGGVYVNLTNTHTLLAELQQGDVIAVKYVGGNAGAIATYGSTSLPSFMKTEFHGHKIA